MVPGSEIVADRVLSQRARAGEPKAFDALVARYQARAYRLAWRMTGNASDAEEIVQEAFFRAHRALPAFHGDSTFGTWLYRIVVNEALMRRRAARRRPTRSMEDAFPRGEASVPEQAEPGAPSVDQLIETKRLTEELFGALAELEEDQRSALVLRDLEGLCAEEVSAILGISPETVRQRAHRARAQLRKLLGRFAQVA
jgi:RNA polymerase sigma-70 factor (ECF subfamily)